MSLIVYWRKMTTLWWYMTVSISFQWCITEIKTQAVLALAVAIKDHHHYIGTRPPRPHAVMTHQAISIFRYSTCLIHNDSQSPLATIIHTSLNPLAQISGLLLIPNTVIRVSGMVCHRVVYAPLSRHYLSCQQAPVLLKPSQYEDWLSGQCGSCWWTGSVGFSCGLGSTPITAPLPPCRSCAPTGGQLRTDWLLATGALPEPAAL